jgi:threonine synthase
VPAPRLARELGLGALSFKNEMVNPTGSFKDRQVSVGITHARTLGADTVAVVSSGNVAASTAAYAARAGLRAVLFMHAFASPDKMAQAAAFGATIVRVDAPPSQVFSLCIAACERWGWQHLSTAGMYEPWNVEGAKTIAYELFQQYEGELPEWIVAPVGGGGLLGGIWRGLLDLRRLGLIKDLPRLCGVQASGCAPLKQAVDYGTAYLDTLRHPWPNPQTIAGGIADDILFDGHTVLPAIRTTGGCVVAVEDDALVAGIHRLARTEGLLCELTTGVVMPALEELARANQGARVCAVLTGSGLKDVNYFARALPEAPLIAPSIAALEGVLGV